jgi:hypothetical protein
LVIIIGAGRHMGECLIAERLGVPIVAEIVAPKRHPAERLSVAW